MFLDPAPIIRYTTPTMPKIQCVCQRCGEGFSLYPSQIRKGGGKFCTQACQNKRMGEDRVCPTCGAEFYAQASRIKRGEGTFCSKVCGNPARGRSGAANGNWKGGQFKRSDGYIAIGVGGGKYRLEHDLIMEAHIGRQLQRGENVHHKNKIRDDNRLENLELMGWAEHIREHHPAQHDPSRWALLSCGNCRVMFQKRASQIKKTKSHFCCRGCYVEARQAGII